MTAKLRWGHSHDLTELTREIIGIMKADHERDFFCLARRIGQMFTSFKDAEMDEVLYGRHVGGVIEKADQIVDRSMRPPCKIGQRYRFRVISFQEGDRCRNNAARAVPDSGINRSAGADQC